MKEALMATKREALEEVPTRGDGCNQGDYDIYHTWRARN